MTFEEIAKKAVSLTQAENEAVARKVIVEYETLLRSMNEELKTLYANTLSAVDTANYFNEASKYNRMGALIEDLQKKYLAASKLIGKETAAAAESAIANSYYRNMFVTNWAVDQSVFAVISQDLIGVSVYGTPEYWKALSDKYGEEYLPQSGTLLHELLTKRQPSVIAAIEQAIRAGLITGESYTKVAARIKKIMETDAASALRIVRTETHRNMMAGQYAAAMDARAQGVEARRMIVSVLDMRTREQSASVDGKLEDDEGYFTYPGGLKVAIPGNSGVAAYDINDREGVTMTVDGTPPELRRARNPATGQTDIINWTSFNDWAKQNNLVYKNGKWVIST